MGLLLDVWANMPDVMAVIVPVIYHHPPVRGSVIFELSQLPWQKLVMGFATC